MAGRMTGQIRRAMAASVREGKWGDQEKLPTVFREG